MAAVTALTAVILWSRPEHEGISRAAVYKAAALCAATAEECRKEAEEEKSFFPAADQGKWYVKYGDFLYRRGILSEESTPADSETAEGFLTCGEAESILEMLEYVLEAEAGADGEVPEGDAAARDEEIPGEEVSVPGKNMQEGSAAASDGEMPKKEAAASKRERSLLSAEEWWSRYMEICGARIEELTLQIYGTPGSAETAPVPAWTAYTDRGTYGFEGLSLDRYLDTEIRVLAKDREIIQVTELVSRSIVCHNAWISEAGEAGIKGYAGEIVRTFPAERKIAETEGLVNQLADLYLTDGQVEKIVLKKDRITARVLAVKEDAIELEGYGPVELDEHFRVYKTYGQFEAQDLSDILVGYDTQEFAAAGGRLCAALIVRTFDAANIRVLLMDTGFHSPFHQKVELEFASDGLMIQDEKKTAFRKGERMTLETGDPLLKEGRIVFRPADESAGIRILSLERGSGKGPVYPGRLEISQEEQGLAVVNDLYLEDYLKRVVPSEMPASYEKEALKAQAVCARTYAYRQIQGNTYKEYGAHVDDSTRFQVYNNAPAGTASDTAVNETYGQILMYGDQVADTYYFSTSCGHTADVTVWGEDLGKAPYLYAKAVRDGGGRRDLTGNDVFAEFIKGCPEGFESGYGMYRWTAEITAARLQEKFPGLGTITNAEITERGEGGIGKTLVIEGTAGTKEIRGEGQIRSALGSASVGIRRQDGKVLTGWTSLPSAFIAIEQCRPEEGQGTAFKIYGGGYGHGIGMSQNGAQAMAERGWKYDEILGFFYEGTNLHTW